MKFALTNLFKQKGLMLIYGLTITLITAICYIFLSMLQDPYFQLNTLDVTQMYMGSGTTLLIIIFGFCLLIYTNIYVLESKNKEISLMVFHGMTFKRMLLYQFYQNTFMYLIFGILGMIAGYIVTPFIIAFIYAQLDLASNNLIITEQFFETTYMLVTMYIIAIILSIGYIHRGKLISMMNNTRQKNYRKKNVLRISSKVYPILYIAGLIMMFTTEHLVSGYIIFSIIGAVGGYGIVKNFLPESIEKHKDYKWINNSHHLVVFGELYLKFKYIGLFLELLILISIIIPTIICFNINNQVEMYRMIVAYIIMLPMIIFCITYKNIIISKKNRKNLKFIYQLGIVKNKEKQFIKEELIYLYGLILILPIIYMIATLARFYVYENISISIIALIVLYFIFNVIISMFISYKANIQTLKEV